MNRRYYCLLIVLFFAVLIQAAAAERTYNILFIQSYTSQTPWHSDLNQGLVKGFKESGLKVNITTEYLDADFWAFNSEKVIMRRFCQRAKHPFVKVNLGGISQSLFESEMFGHKKGAFTDASADRIGRFEMANKGTIFLDEIGDLDPSCQVKLLRVLQDQTFEVLGDSRPRKTDIRVVSATNADLRKMVGERIFREDLFYRINLITVKLPALRERREDIPLLARHFADRQAVTNGLPRTEFSADALQFLSRLPYPGNIRELKNLVERTILVSGKPLLDASDFDAQYIRHDDARVTEGAALAGMTLDEIERQTILQALDRYKGNLSQVATALGISRAALYRRLEKYNITM